MSSLRWLSPLLDRSHSSIPLRSCCPHEKGNGGSPATVRIHEIASSSKAKCRLEGCCSGSRTGLGSDALQQAQLCLPISIFVSVPCVIVFEVLVFCRQASLRHQRKAGSLKAVRTKLSLQIGFHTFDTAIKDWRHQTTLVRSKLAPVTISMAPVQLRR